MSKNVPPPQPRQRTEQPAAPQGNRKRALSRTRAPWETGHRTCRQTGHFHRQPRTARSNVPVGLLPQLPRVSLASRTGTCPWALVLALRVFLCAPGAHLQICGSPANCSHNRLAVGSGTLSLRLWVDVYNGMVVARIDVWECTLDVIVVVFQTQIYTLISSLCCVLTP